MEMLSVPAFSGQTDEDDSESKAASPTSVSEFSVQGNVNLEDQSHGVSSEPTGQNSGQIGPSTVDLEGALPVPSMTSQPKQPSNIHDGIDLSQLPPPKPVVTEFPTSLARVAQALHWLQKNPRFPVGAVELLSSVLNFVCAPFFRGTCARRAHLEDTASQPYVCVGYLSKSDDLQSEVMVEVTDPKSLFPQLRTAVYKVWGWHYIFSLKSLQAFGLYEVDVLRCGFIPNDTLIA